MGKVVTFYSYKGGAGRTMALANLAWILASNGRRVLAVDWDLESPGLHRYFHPFLADPRLESTPGVVEMIRDAAAGALAVREGGGDAQAITDWHARHANVARHAFSIDWPFPDGGTLDLLPAGRQEPGYGAEVSTFDWGSFYEWLGGRQFLDMLGESMRDTYDYVLIDSRTGLSDVAGIVIVRLPDVVVNCFTLNTQSIAGALSIAAYLPQADAERAIRILPVPMRIEDAEQSKLEAGRDYARVSFAPYLSALSADEVEQYWNEVEIPYRAYYAYEEILAAFGDRPRQETSLLAAYERLTGVLTDRGVTRLRPVGEEERRLWLAEFERPRAAVPSSLLLSYASVDRTWAEWIAAELEDTGLSVTLHDVTTRSGVDYLDEAAGLISRHSRLLALLSPAYVAAANARDLWKLAAEGPSGGRQFLTPIRLDSRRYPSPFADRTAIDLSGLGEDRTRVTLLEGLDRRRLAESPHSGTSPARRRPRFPADPPPVWNVTARNSTFTGRDALLDRLRDHFVSAVTRIMPQVLIGLGGVGKTQIALEYAHRFAADYDTVWWISAVQASQVRSTLAALAVELNVAGPGSDVTERVRAALDALRRGTRWLIIMDNADEPDELRELLPQGGGHVLITSRNPAWHQAAEVIPVEVFDRDESVALLRRRVPHISEKDAVDLAARLGDLPLVIDQAGAWLSTTAMPVSQYLKMLSEQLPSILAQRPPGPRLPQYPDSAAATWLLSLTRMRDEMPAAAKVLEVCAFFAPEPIPLSLLSGDQFLSYLRPFDPSLVDPFLLQGRVIWEIGRYALARIDPGQSTIQLHRLVQAVVADSLSPEAQQESRQQAHSILSAANPKDPDRPENWPVYAALLPHVVPSGALDSADPDVRQFIVHVVRYLWRSGDIVSSQELAEQTLASWDPDNASNQPLILILRFHLANSYRYLARYKEAYEIDREVHARFVETAGDQDPYTLMVALSLGGDLREMGQYRQSRELDEHTLAGFRERYGEDHERTLMAANNLAVALRMTGEFREATHIDEDTLARRRSILGPRHPHSLFSAANLARDLREHGIYLRSHQLLEDTLAACSEVMGTEHPETLRTANSFAVSYNKLAQFPAARTLAMDTLVTMQRVHGHDHTDTLACAVNLACDESSLGDTPAARARAEDALQRYRATRGSEHLLTLACEHNLAIFVRDLGEADTARALSEHAMTSMAQILGDQHPYTVLSRANLTNDLFALGDVRGALRWDELNFELLGEVLGEEHPDTLAVGSCLAVSLEHAGRGDEADALTRRLATISRKVLGDTHPNTLLVSERQRINVEIEPPWV